ncbi:hypothetical protein CCY99_02985 [Helicobacter sp. 16-1353]|uniref:molybdopterin molybdotransferase MoeA n=1 Tax=Helicobacter sp. 16-1353 TaxID=2004996 RepID=UPI000DCEF9CF|nr:molybdopterin molybdotransferase MoeA [Helicobacter sp. 16-1353]RAX54741.1 hypothetical protein CCY99_02985 [Helicobacter sp. 16-1353]
MNKYVTFNEALKLIQQTKINELGIEKIFINQSVGRILYNDIRAKDNMPKFDTSNMDGYAFCYDDLEILKNSGLTIDSINKAGNEFKCEVKKGFCIKTFTGSKMPENADSLVIVEQVKVVDNKIFLKQNENVEKAKWIRKKGENYKKNDILLHKGTHISPFDIGILAQNNNVFVEVYRQPKVAILTSGDEILEIGEIPNNDNYIYSSNNHILNAIVSSLGCIGSIYPILKDSNTTIKNALKDALKQNDVVITTGGMSKGDFDFTKNIIGEFGSSIFESVQIKPGKVISYINCNADKHIIALPGNPISCVVSFLLFGRLIIAKMLGVTPTIPIHKAKLINDIKDIDTSRMEFALADLYLRDGKYEVELKPNRQSYMINNINGAMILIDKKPIKKDNLVDIILLDELIKLKGL